MKKILLLGIVLIHGSILLGSDQDKKPLRVTNTYISGDQSTHVIRIEEYSPIIEIWSSEIGKGGYYIRKISDASDDPMYWTFSKLSKEDKDYYDRSRDNSPWAVRYKKRLEEYTSTDNEYIFTDSGQLVIEAFPREIYRVFKAPTRGKYLAIENISKDSYSIWELQLNNPRHPQVIRYDEVGSSYTGKHTHFLTFETPGRPNLKQQLCISTYQGIASVWYSSNETSIESRYEILSSEQVIDLMNRFHLKSHLTARISRTHPN